jgi:hypothetical protein
MYDEEDVMVEYRIKRGLIAHLQEYYTRPSLDWVGAFVDGFWGDVPTEELRHTYSIRWQFQKSTENRLILRSGYDGEYSIVINSDLIHENLKAEFTIELKRAIVHEDTHRQQHQGAFDPAKVPGPDKETPLYLSSPAEIAARGREIAQFFEEQGISVEDAIASIESGTNLGPYEDVVAWYHEIGGSVLHKYLSEVYRYLEGDNVTP